jgi:hypothetical protein
MINDLFQGSPIWILAGAPNGAILLPQSVAGNTHAMLHFGAAVTRMRMRLPCEMWGNSGSCCIHRSNTRAAHDDNRQRILLRASHVCQPNIAHH